MITRSRNRRDCIFATALLIASSCALPAKAQGRESPGPRDSVLAVVQQFFNTMTLNDSTAASRTVHPASQSFSFQPRGDSVALSVATMGRFLATLPRNMRTYVERMWEPTVMLHGPIAVVWTAYDFHIDGVFSHCGVDAFTLVRTAGAWRIANITYTVEPSGCKPSPLGPLKKP